jgi:hypothetical protein
MGHMATNLHSSATSFLSFFLSQSDLFYLLIVGMEGYCCILSYTHTDAHTHMHTVGLL